MAFAVQNEDMESTGELSGWVSYSDGPGGRDHLPSDVRAEVEARAAIRKGRQGELLCEVQVRVYEHDIDEGTDMQVSFPAGAVLSPDSDPSQIAAAVARAREALASWR